MSNKTETLENGPLEAVAYCRCISRKKKIMILKSGGKRHFSD
jgi:hypothetical protein